MIFNIVGNMFAGAVKGETAASLSKSFGKEDKETRSFQESDSSDHTTFSYQLRDVLPAHKIEALSQGFFCGYVADNHDQQINPKIFCGEVLPGKMPKHNERIPKILNISQEELDIEMDNNYKKIRMDIISILKKELQ